MEDSREPDVAPIGSRAVKALLTRNNIPPSRHVTLLAEILGIAYAPVHRRMKGVVAWEIEELDRVAASFGETLGSLFGEPAPVMTSAHVSIDSRTFPCQIELGEVIQEPAENTLVAARVSGQWRVIRAASAPPGTLHHVVQMRVQTPAKRRFRVAVLDDDEGEVASLADHFNDHGCETLGFTRVDELVTAMRHSRFDGFVVDWVLREGSASELIAMIRAEDKTCPIAVLTGKLGSGFSDVEADLAQALPAYRLMFFEKPSRVALISSQLLHAMAAR